VRGSWLGAVGIMRKAFVVLAALCAASVCARANDVSPPIAEGHYIFLVRFAEHRNMMGGQVEVEIRGGHILVTSKPNASVFPAGVVDEGILLWHATSKQWIIGENKADADIAEVGGCSDGPYVVDLERKVFWTC
jgi:hypothetical protein